jgi:hypothetical protein
MEGKLDLARVQKKLAETQFFLGNMVEQERRAFGDREPFDFYLSAFLSAGRTVDYRLRHEQSPIYPIWRKVWDAALLPTANRLIKFMVDDRNTEVHASGSSRSVGQEDIKVGAGGSYSDRSGTLEVFGPPSVLLGVDTGAVIHKPTYNFTIDGTERKATEACTEYLALLKRMVEKFEETATEACAEYLALLDRMMKKSSPPQP